MRIKPTVVVSASGNSPPLIEPDRRFSRIRLSEAVHRTRCRAEALRGATQCPWEPASRSVRFYLPEGSHRTALDSAVHVDQVRSLRSSPVTGLRRYDEPLRLLPRPNGPHGFAACARRGTSPPSGGDLIPCPLHPSSRTRSCRAFPAKRPNWPDETCTHGWLVFGIAPTDFTDEHG